MGTQVNNRIQAWLTAVLLLAGVPRALASWDSRAVEDNLEVVIGTRLDGSEVRYESLPAEDGPAPISVNAFPTCAQPCDAVEITGHETEDDFDAHDWPKGSPFFTQKHRIAVLLLRFSKDGNALEPTLSRAEVEQVVFEQGARYIQDASYGKATIEGSVFGWYTLPFEPTCDTEAIRKSALELADRHVNYWRYGHVVLAFPTVGCGFGGWGTIGKTRLATQDGTVNASVMWINGYMSLGIFAHEFGHNLGLDHASSLRCPTPDGFGPECADTEYADPYDAMGNAFPGHYSFHNKQQLGWLTDSQVESVVASPWLLHHPMTFALSPLETPGGLKGIEIPFSLPDGKRSAYLIEYRQPIGMDARNRWAMDGALIRMTMKSEHQSRVFVHTHLLPMPRNNSQWWKQYPLTEGSRYELPYTGLAIETIGQEDGDLLVRVAAEPPERYASSDDSDDSD